jgi:hypothetical protein
VSLIMLVRGAGMAAVSFRTGNIAHTGEHATPEKLQHLDNTQLSALAMHLQEDIRGNSRKAAR